MSAHTEASVLVEFTRDQYDPAAAGPPWKVVQHRAMAAALADARNALAEIAQDAKRLDWMAEQVDGNASTLSFGGVCSWGLDLKEVGKKSRRIGEGGNLREAIDDAVRAADADGTVEP